MKRFFRAFGYPDVVWFPKTERSFLAFICVSFILALFATPFPQYAMWVGFLFAAYAAIANDSIQTIGTFIASNQDKKWWVLWIFIGGIFVSTMSYSWLTVDESGITVLSTKYENLNSDLQKQLKSECLQDPTCAKYLSDPKELNKKLQEKYSDFLGLKSKDTEPFKIEISSKNNNFVAWNIANVDDGATNYSSDYLNEDYGTCFFINQNNELCHVTNISKKDKESTYFEYDEVSFINLVSGESGAIIFDKLNYKLFPNGHVDRDVSHARLSAKGYEKSPRNFHFLQIAAPIFLLILTRLRMPVSTTFILLTSFAIGPAAVGKVLAKSMSGYILSFILGISFFMLVAKASKKYFTGKAKFGWTIAQWITSGTLWAVWLTQDAANIAVYLNRSMSGGSFFTFLLVIFIGLGLLLYFKGGRIQKIVTEKSVVTDVRFATLIDFIYCIILFYFKLHSKVPMSTTWVFIGLLAGRELGMALMKTGDNSILKSLRLGLKDMTFALIGLIISIAIAVGVNDQLTLMSMFTTIPAEFADGVVKFFKTLGV